jgi:NAD+ synthase (glutamine-hydrolysing)
MTASTEPTELGRPGTSPSEPTRAVAAPERHPVDTIALPAGITVGDGLETTVLGADAEVYSALVLGLKDYVHKNGFGAVVLGLSGGIDSSLVAAIACDALGPHHVHGVSMPSAYSSQHSRDDAAELADRTGLRYRIVSIEPMVAAFQGAMHLTSLAEENLQARVRGVILMGISNAEGPLVLATGNKTELAVGYSTI